MCISCYKLIGKHNASAVKTDEVIRKALEYSQEGEKVPSCILDPEEGLGGLYLGGFKGVVNKKFLASAGITHVVNTAKGLEMFGPSYTNALQNAKDAGIDFLEMNWMDDMEQKLSSDDIRKAILYIEQARIQGGSVFVHCAQGKSRSSTVVVSYLKAREPATPLLEHIERMQQRRAMASPNRNFMEQLKAHEKETLFDGMLEKGMESDEGCTKDSKPEAEGQEQEGIFNTAAAATEGELGGD
jgi:protein-tyrosine phosphatase